MPDLNVVDEFAEWQATRKGLTGTYVYQSRQKLLHLARWLGDTDWTELDEPLLERWAWRERRNGQEPAASTIEKDIAVVRSFYGFLMRRGIVFSDPTADIVRPKIRNRMPRPIADATWLEWYARPKYIEDDCILFMGLGYLVGLRRAEILRVRGDMIVGGQIQGLVRKGGGDDAIDVPTLVQIVARGLPKLLPDGGDRFLSVFRARSRQAGLLLDWRESARGWGRVHELPEDENDPQWVYKRVRKWQRWANPRPEALWTPHSLRHGFVTNLLRCNVPLPLVSASAAHSDYKVTMRYAKLGNADLRNFLQAQSDGKGYQPNRFDH